MLRAYICRNLYFTLPLRNCFPFSQNVYLGSTIHNMSFSILYYYRIYIHIIYILILLCIFLSLYSLCAWMLGVLSWVPLFTTPWTAARQAPLSMGFSRQEYWSGLPCPPPEDHPNPGIEPMPPAAPALQGGFFAEEPLWKPLLNDSILIYSVVIQKHFVVYLGLWGVGGAYTKPGKYIPFLFLLF